MRKAASILALAAMAMAENNDTLGKKRRYMEDKETAQERQKRLAKAEIERFKAQGLKEFFYGENSLWAINQKVADKKAAKRNWIKGGQDGK